MRKIKARWPNISNLRLIMVTYAFTFVLDFVMEAGFMLPFGLYTYPGAIRSVSVFAGTYHQWPIYEGLMWGGVQAALCCLRYFTDDRGRTIVERGLDHVRGGFARQQFVRFLAIFAAVSACFFFFYNVPAQWIGMHSDPWPEDHLKRSYFNGGICGDGTDEPCPDPALPIPPSDPATSTPTANSSFRRAQKLPKTVPFERGIEMLTNSHAVVAQSRSEAPFYRAVGDEVEVFRAAARRGLPVLLKGPTGCGKTRFVEAMAHELGRDLITVAGHEDMTSADLVGRFLLKGGETVWVDGPLTRAVREGAICYLDEVVEARQDTIVVIHPLADHRRELPIDRLGTTLPAAPGFQLVISYNPGYQSVLKNIKESTRQRFVAIELDFPPAETETEVVAHEAGIDAETARALVKLGNAIRNLDGSPLREVSSTRMLILAGGLVAEGLSLRSAVQSAIVQVLSDDPDVVRALGELADAVLPRT